MNQNTLLLRQVHPSWVQEKRPTSQAFRPTPKDEQQLSVYDGDQISPAASWQHYTQSLQMSSCGVMAVTVAECFAQGLCVGPDPTRFPEHVLIYFSAYSKRETEKKAKFLRDKAEARGWLHP